MAKVFFTYFPAVRRHANPWDLSPAQLWDKRMDELELARR
jgi:hypothetical protein